MKIYVAMHKAVSVYPSDEIYQPLLVGNNGKEGSLILTDDTGENISDKNKNYCELTGLYWIWKNSDADIVGLCHYRRFFAKDPFSGGKRNILCGRDIQKDILEEGVDLILPRKTYFEDALITERSTAPSQSDMSIVRQVLAETYPDHLQDFDAVCNAHEAYLYNVMICRKTLLNDYCSWLFSILFETERRLPRECYDNDAYRRRLFGFISERLLNVWVHHNAEKLVIKEYPVINTEQNFVSRIKWWLAQETKKYKWKIVKQKQEHNH